MPKRILEGVVVSGKGDATVVAKVEKTIVHPLLKKIVTVRRDRLKKQIREKHREALALAAVAARQRQDERGLSDAEARSQKRLLELLRSAEV